MINYQIQSDAIDRTKTHDALITNVYFSLRVKQGGWFFNPDFGCRWHTIKKLDTDGLRRAEDYAREALKWLVDLGRISSIDATAERDDDNFNQCNVRLILTKADNKEVEFNTFFRVV